MNMPTKTQPRMTTTQRVIYARMHPGAKYSAYDLGCSLATLDAMARKGYIRRSAGLGALAFPRNSILYWREQEKTA